MAAIVVLPGVNSSINHSILLSVRIKNRAGTCGLREVSEPWAQGVELRCSAGSFQNNSAKLGNFFKVHKF